MSLSQEQNSVTEPLVGRIITSDAVGMAIGEPAGVGIVSIEPVGMTTGEADGDGIVVGLLVGVAVETGLKVRVGLGSAVAVCVDSITCKVSAVDVDSGVGGSGNLQAVARTESKTNTVKSF